MFARFLQCFAMSLQCFCSVLHGFHTVFFVFLGVVAVVFAVIEGIPTPSSPSSSFSRLHGPTVAKINSKSFFKISPNDWIELGGIRPRTPH